MISSKTSVSFGGSRNVESDSGLSKKCSALQFVISLILPASVGPIVQKKSLNSLAITEGSLEITLFILREKGGSRFNLFGSTDRTISQVLRALLLFLLISERKSFFFDKALSLVRMSDLKVTKFGPPQFFSGYALDTKSGLLKKSCPIRIQDQFALSLK